MYPAYLLWGRSTVRLAIAALLYWLRPGRRAGNLLGVSEGRNLEQGKTWSNMTQLRFGGPKTEETVKKPCAVLTLPAKQQRCSGCGRGATEPSGQHSIANENAQDENSTVCYVTVSGCG